MLKNTFLTKSCCLMAIVFLSLPFRALLATEPKAVFDLESPFGSIRAMVFAPDGKTIAMAGLDGPNITLWNIRNGKRKVLGRDNVSGSTSSLAFSPDGKMLAQGEMERVRLWDLTTGKICVVLPVHNPDFHGLGVTADKLGVYALAFSPDGKTLAVGGMDVFADGKKPGGRLVESKIALWDVKTGKLRSSLRGYEQSVSALAFSPDGRILASGGGTRWIHGLEYPKGPGELKLWELATQKVMFSSKERESGVYCLAFSPDGKKLAVGGARLKMWDMTSRKAKTFQLEAEWIASIAFSPDGKTLAVPSPKYSVSLLDAHSGKQRSKLTAKPPRERMTWKHKGIAFSPDGGHIAAITTFRTVHLWSVPKIAGKKDGTLNDTVGKPVAK